MATTAIRSEGPMVLPRAFALLRLLAEEAQGLTLSVIAASLEAPKSSLSSTLKALTEQGFLTRNGSLYFLGSESYSLASVILAGRTIRQIARPYLEKTMETCGETVLLATMESDLRHFSYIDAVDSTKSVRYSVPIGSRRPLYATACGRLFLAYQSDVLQQAYFENVALDRVTDITITDRPALQAILRDIRQSGVSVTLGDFSNDAAGFAAPIFNSEGDLMAALVIGAPLSRGQREKDQYSAAVIQSARAISKVLGHKEDRTAA